MGQLQTNCYLIWDNKSKEAMVVDPADDGVGLAEEIERAGLKLNAILATHGHFDHLLGALDLKLIYNAPFYCSAKDYFLLERQQETAKYFLKQKIRTPNLTKIDVNLDEIESINLGDSEIVIIKTPGHTPGSVCFYCPREKIVFTGDTLFREGVGSTEHKYSSKEDLRQSIEKLRNLGQDVIILPGH